MKLSEKWLREWVNPSFSREALMHHLTMAGIGIESFEIINSQDCIIEFELTPNRGDCLSVLGIAREIAILKNIPVTLSSSHDSPVLSSAAEACEMAVEVHSPEDCPHYIGQVIKNIRPGHTTPKDIAQKLSSSGIKLIHPVVDVLNYVMLELGQPLHAFDLDKINKKIIVRRAKAGEAVILLDHQNISLSEDTLVIADTQQVHAIAGIMGGLESAVTENTRAIFIESAFFTPGAITGRARRYGLHTEASYRFERGVDPSIAQQACERAIGLLLEIYDNNLTISRTVIQTTEKYLPVSPVITLRFARVEKILGIKLSEKQIELILIQKLICHLIDKHTDHITVRVPSYRFDLQSEIDLIEEIARLYGYENFSDTELPMSHTGPAEFKSPCETVLPISELKKCLVHQGYQEIITYSFISEAAQRQFDPDLQPLTLINPLSAGYAVMRTNLWAGLLEAVLYNLKRQQEYLRFFETGLRFISDKQEAVLSGVWAGRAFPEQWSEKNRHVDFFDLKNNLIQLFSLTGDEKNFSWEASVHPALHPGQTAKIYREKIPIGFCGSLHPKLQQSLDIPKHVPVFLFEIQLEALRLTSLPSFQSLSKFPAMRRDIALIVDYTVQAKQLENIIYKNAGDALTEVNIFDIYYGQENKNLPLGKKSLALSLIFQDREKTLLEEEIQRGMQAIIRALETETGAKLRD